MEIGREGGLGVRDYRGGSGATLGISGTSDTNHDHENNDKSNCSHDGYLLRNPI